MKRAFERKDDQTIKREIEFLRVYLCILYDVWKYLINCFNRDYAEQKTSNSYILYQMKHNPSS